MTHLAGLAESDLIAIDGKTPRRSYDRADGKTAPHMVSAWCRANPLTLGQLATDQKSNEITAIPKLLKLLDLEETVVTIDAMGTQKGIARQITERGGDYLPLSVKWHIRRGGGNQETLCWDVALFLDEGIRSGFRHTPPHPRPPHRAGRGRNREGLDRAPLLHQQLERQRGQAGCWT